MTFSPGALLVLIVMIFGPAAWLLMGEVCLEAAFAAIARRTEEHAPTRDSLLAYLLFGLLLYISLILLLGFFGIPVAAAGLMALLPGLVRYRRARELIALMHPVPSVNFALWFTVILAFGASIIAVIDGIQTPWRNNYGDLAWHLGMISSFVFGGNVPPQNHIFPPDWLSYPFFINLWTAALWSLNPTLNVLGWVFLYQWTFLWVVVYFALDGNRFRVLPWAVLFGGGALVVIFHEPKLAAFGPYAYDLIGHGYPWVPFIDSVWLVQRPTIFGAPIVLASVRLAHDALYGEGLADGERERRAFFSGAVLGLSPLVHTHFFLATGLYLGGVFFLATFPREGREEKARLFAWFLLAVAPAAIFAPWILGKSGIVEIAGAWMQKDIFVEKGTLAAAAAGFRLWSSNAAAWIILAGLGVLVTGRYVAGVVLLALFAFGNVIQFAAWDWDEIKFFIALYLISIAIWQTGRTKAAWYLHWWLVLLLVPALGEVYIALMRYERFSVYSAQDVARAEGIRAVTPPNAIIAGAPNHNSTLTLTGRRMFYGYEGTLHSHGLDYEGRGKVQKDLESLKACRTSGQPLCPDYLFWTDPEKEYWKVQEPGEGVEATTLPYLFRIP